MEIMKLESLELYSVSYKAAGAGHKRIEVELCFNSQYKEFSAITTDMHSFDEAMDLDGKSKYEALFSLIYYKIEDEINEWLNEINN